MERAILRIVPFRLSSPFLEKQRIYFIHPVVLNTIIRKEGIAIRESNIMRHPTSFLLHVVLLFCCSLVVTHGFSIAPWDFTKRKDNATFLSQLFMSSKTTGDDQTPKAKKRSARGGRAAGTADQVGGSSEQWTPTPCQPDEVRLAIIQITDTYTLEHLPSVKTMIKDIREKAIGSTVLSCMTGDFLAPYLLSSVDRGQGMMNAMAKIPIDYLTWGNHEVRL